MGHNQKHIYLEAIYRRYHQSGRIKKAKILDEFCEVCGYNRKYAIRLMHQYHARKRRKKQNPGRQRRYQVDRLLVPLKAIWFASNQMCSKKLKVALQEWLPHYEQEHGVLDDDVRGQLLSLSAATLDRILKPIRVTWPRKGLSGTKPGRLLKKQIPLRTDHWDVNKPGFMEADTVAHCGNSLAGDFVWSLTLTDIQSAWTEIRATWNKGSTGVIHQIQDIEKGLPFEILGFDSDNGSEFLNYHLIHYFTERPKEVQFTRSRPYHKNDNAHVEQKNWTHVRHLFGYDRFEDPQLVNLMNDLYKNEWSLYQNHFCPTMKLIAIERINARYRKQYDKPQTPYQRLLTSAYISEAAKINLEVQHKLLNPFALKRGIEVKLKQIFQLVSVTSFVRQRI